MKRESHNIVAVPGREGLIMCTVCEGEEGTIPTDCPGRPMSIIEEDVVYQGLGDFIMGRWVSDVDEVINVITQAKERVELLEVAMKGLIQTCKTNGLDNGAVDYASTSLNYKGD